MERDVWCGRCLLVRRDSPVTIRHDTPRKRLHRRDLFAALQIERVGLVALEGAVAKAKERIRIMEQQLQSVCLHVKTSTVRRGGFKMLSCADCGLCRWEVIETAPLRAIVPTVSGDPLDPNR